MILINYKLLAMRYFLSALILLLCITGFTQTQPVAVTDMLKIKTASGIRLTKDGTKLAFVVTSIEPESDSSKWEYRYTSQVWTSSTEPGSTAKQLTYSREGASQPAWSPDGKQLA